MTFDLSGALNSGPFGRRFCWTAVAGGDSEPSEECGQFNTTSWKRDRQTPRLRVQFLQFSRSDPDCPRAFQKEALSHLLQSPLFNASLPTRIIIHGYRAVGSKPTWVTPLAQTLLAVGEANVLAVDWLYQASFPYPLVVQHYKDVALEVSVLINALKDQGSSLESFHLIGVSLGAHVCGFVGTLFGGKVGRITGLDPAGPLVNRRDRYDRLDPSDALFVEAIHTDADNFGISIPIGHVSFFPNGGKDQPGCTRSLIPAVFSYVICDHMRAVHLYMSALNGSCPLAGIPCPSYEDFLDGRCLDCRETFDGTCPRIGLQEKSGITIALPPEEEKLYLFTSQAPPYCAKHILLEMEVSPQTRSTEVQVTLRSLGHPDTKQRIKLHTGTSVYKRTFPLPVSLCAVDSIHMQNTATWFNRKEDVRFLSICLSEFPPRREDAPLCVTHVDLWKSTPWSHDFVHLCSDP
ncbi:phospholipase A1 member A isoform X1 [Scleropages formosus]|uniref:phospholipase A1 member A isoform X1 n=1 Tax=Scleropages formosus TaxID=113540 RepID=UPI0010FA704B|nr:phospholipase A1 member A isoform X1 [Scleropages formosus]